MYYEASTILTTHPDIGYDDGISHIFLYCNGRPNFDSMIALSIFPMNIVKNFRKC